jgi:hypothetical protein
MAVRWRRRAARPTTIASASHDGTDDHCGFAWKRSSGGGAPWNAPGQPQPRGAGGDSRLCGNQCDELQIARAAVGGGTSRLGADVCPRSAVFGGKPPPIPANPGAFEPAQIGPSRAKSPANRHDSSPARARIAPRRSPVRVRLAPLREPLQPRGLCRLSGVRVCCRSRRFGGFGPVFGPISAGFAPIQPEFRPARGRFRAGLFGSSRATSEAPGSLSPRPSRR